MAREFPFEFNIPIWNLIEPWECWNGLEDFTFCCCHTVWGSPDLVDRAGRRCQIKESTYGTNGQAGA